MWPQKAPVPCGVHAMNVLNQTSGDNWSLINGDCVDVVNGLPENSLHLTITSPPYLSLYTYSNSDRDFGNCSSDEQFYEHFDFLVQGLHRATKPGRIVVVDCMDIASDEGARRVHWPERLSRRRDPRVSKAGPFSILSIAPRKDPLIEATRTKGAWPDAQAALQGLYALA